MRFIKFLIKDIIETLKDNRGIAPLIPAMIAAGAGYGLSKLRRKPRERRIEPSTIPFTSLTEIPAASALNQKILGGLQGQGVGFPEGFTRRSTSPFVAQRLSDLEGERAQVSDIFAGRGLGRSSLAGRAEGETVSQANRDINQIMADAELKNIQQTKADEARYQNLALQYGQAEAGQRNVAAGLDASITAQNVGLQGQRDALLRQQRDLEIGLPLSMAGNVLGGQGGAMGSLGNAMSSSGFGLPQNQQGLNQLLEQITSARRAQPFTSGQGVGASGAF